MRRINVTVFAGRYRCCGASGRNTARMQLFACSTQSDVNPKFILHMNVATIWGFRIRGHEAVVIRWLGQHVTRLPACWAKSLMHINGR